MTQMTQVATSPVSSMAALRVIVTTALANALATAEIVAFRRRRDELPHDYLWRRRARIAELAVDEVVQQGVEHDTAARVVPKIFEAICQGQDFGLARQLIVV